MDWYRGLYEALASRYTLVKFDPRGTGLSDRSVADFTLPARAADLGAVVNSLGLEQFALLGQLQAGPVTLRYAIDHPDSVSKLLLLDTFARTRDWIDLPAVKGISKLQTRTWDALLEVGARSSFGWDAPAAEQVAEVGREGVDPKTFVRLSVAAADIDLTESLSQIRCPTLILVHSGSQVSSVDLARSLAAGIPSSVMRVIPGTPADTAPLLEAVGEFLGATEPGPPTSGLRTLLFTDLESSTALTQALGDAKAQEILHGHNDAVRAALAAHEGEEVKHTGDGIFAAFGSAVSAVEAALQIQRDLAGAEVRVRIGLNAGEPIAEDDDYFGTAVQLASRVCDRAEPGQILVSNVVRELCAGKTFTFTDQGEVTLKGFEEPVRLFTVGGD